MKKIIIIIAISSIFTSCNSNQTSEKELELQKKELNLKQRELEIRENEIKNHENLKIPESKNLDIQITKQDKQTESIEDNWSGVWKPENEMRYLEIKKINSTLYNVEAGQFSDQKFSGKLYLKDGKLIGTVYANVGSPSKISYEVRLLGSKQKISLTEVFNDGVNETSSIIMLNVNKFSWPKPKVNQVTEDVKKK